MRLLPLIVGCLLATQLAAQSPSGRHFRRDPRLPTTPAASAVVDASARTGALTPLAKLHSGRPWPRHHFGRLPEVESAPATQAVDASHTTGSTPRGFWRKRR